MAFLMKRVSGSSKGLVIFNHKENRHLQRVFPQKLEALKSKFIVGLHFGGHHVLPRAPFGYDFYLSGETTATFKEKPSVPHLHFCSRNFCNPAFKKRDLPKHWDIAFVSTISPVKKVEQFLETVGELYRRGHRYRVLMVCPQSWTPSDEAREYGERIIDQFEQTLPDEARDLVDFMFLRGGKTKLMYPVQASSLAILLNQSRTMTLYSDAEGESRIIAEALVTGIPVVAKRHLVGGGLDFLNPSNSELFGNVSEAADAFVKIVSNYKNYEFATEPYEEKLSATKSIPKFIEALKLIYKSHGVPFEGEVDTVDLDRKLPSHIANLPECATVPGELILGDLSSEYFASNYIDWLLDDGQISQAQMRHNLLYTYLNKFLVPLRKLAKLKDPQVRARFLPIK